MNVEKQENILVSDVDEVQVFVDGELVFHHTHSDSGDVSKVELFDYGGNDD
jgi:hypothetical protein